MPDVTMTGLTAATERRLSSSALGRIAARPALEALVQEAVLPRLTAQHGARRGPPAAAALAEHRLHWAARARQLAGSLVRLELPEAARLLRLLNPGGRRFELLCHDVLLPAAELLRLARDAGHLQEVDYLMSVWRLRMLLIGLDDDPGAARPSPSAGMAALLVAAPSAAPSLEDAVVLRLFQRAGWSVQCCGRRAEADPREAARQQRFDLAWFSVDQATDLRSLCGTVAEVRRASCNPTMRVLSGWQRDMPPPPAAMLGADALTADATVAVSLARRVLALH